MNKTTEESQLENILNQIQKLHGDDFLLIVTPDGNGNIALKGKEKEFTNILFQRLSSIIAPPPNKVH